MPVRARLFVAVAIALALTPLLLQSVQPSIAGAAPIVVLVLIVSESLKGLVIGLIGRLFFAAAGDDDERGVGVDRAHGELRRSRR